MHSYHFKKNPSSGRVFCSMDSLKNDIFVQSKVSMSPRILLSNKKIEIILHRLASQLIEQFNDFDDVVLVGLQPRGIYLLNRLVELSLIHI